MAVHVWLALENNRPGVRCVNCFQVSREPHQHHPCMGSEDETGIPNGFKEWLSEYVYEGVTDKMTAQIWDGLPDWAQKSIEKRVEAQR